MEWEVAGRDHDSRECFAANVALSLVQIYRVRFKAIVFTYIPIMSMPRSKNDLKTAYNPTSISLQPVYSYL
jgi:hypothetical protein